MQFVCCYSDIGHISWNSVICTGLIPSGSADSPVHRWLWTVPMLIQQCCAVHINRHCAPGLNIRNEYTMGSVFSALRDFLFIVGIVKLPVPAAAKRRNFPIFPRDCMSTRSAFASFILLVSVEAMSRRLVALRPTLFRLPNIIESVTDHGDPGSGSWDSSLNSRCRVLLYHLTFVSPSLSAVQVYYPPPQQ